jgi:Asp-tRNA(Asn)/Glu-tRNA(Gln) amidotransferase A subunit family amidase
MQGKPISIFDGVPFAAKDNQDAAEYPTRGGTSFLHQQRVSSPGTQLPCRTQWISGACLACTCNCRSLCLLASDDGRTVCAMQPALTR